MTGTPNSRADAYPGRHRRPVTEPEALDEQVVPATTDTDRAAVVPEPQVKYGEVRASSYSWAALSRVGTQACQLTGFVVLSRILLPQAFGVMAAIAVFVALGQLFTDLGIGPAIVHRAEPTQAFLSTAFWINVLSGVALTIIVAALGYPLSLWYRMPELVWLVPIVALTFTFSISTVNVAVLERRAEFRRLAWMEVMSMFAGYATGVVVALHWHSVVALAIIPLVTAAVLSSLTMTFGQWRPALTFSRAEFLAIRGYIGYLTTFNVVVLTARNADDFLIGRVWGPAALGYYSRAYQLMLLPLQQINMGVGRTLQAAFAKNRDNREEVQRLHERAEVAAAALGWFVAAIVIATAPFAVPAILGPNWHPAVPLLQIMALASPPQAITGLNGALYMATGNVSLLLKSGLANCAVLLVLLLSSVWFSITWVAIAFTVQAFTSVPIGILPICRRLGISLGKLPIRFAGLGVAATALTALLAGPVYALGWQHRPGPAFAVQLAVLGTLAAVAAPFAWRRWRAAGSGAVPDPVPPPIAADEAETVFLVGDRL